MTWLNRMSTLFTQQQQNKKSSGEEERPSNEV